MKTSPWLWPALGIGTAVVTTAAAYLILRFAPYPVETAFVVVPLLLIALAALGYVATTRGQAAPFVAIALLLPYLLIGALTYAGADRASAELDALFEGEDYAVEDEFFDGEDLFEDESTGEETTDGTYGSDPELDALYDDCVAGDELACDDLYWQSPGGSEYEQAAEEYGGF